MHACILISFMHASVLINRFHCSEDSDHLLQKGLVPKKGLVFKTGLVTL